MFSCIFLGRRQKITNNDQMYAVAWPGFGIAWFRANYLCHRFGATFLFTSVTFNSRVANQIFCHFSPMRLGTHIRRATGHRVI